MSGFVLDNDWKEIKWDLVFGSIFARFFIFFTPKKDHHKNKMLFYTAKMWYARKKKQKRIATLIVSVVAAGKWISRSRNWCSKSVAYRIIRIPNDVIFIVIFLCLLRSPNCWSVCMCVITVLYWVMRRRSICRCFLVQWGPCRRDELLNVIVQQQTLLIQMERGCFCFAKLHINQGMPRTILCFRMDFCFLYRFYFSFCLLLAVYVYIYILIVGRLSYAQDVSIANWYGFKVKYNEREKKNLK